MTPLSVAIITFNEERAIGRCIASVAGVADEVVVIDSASTDRTRAICESMGARVIVHAFEGYVAQKNVALDHCRNDAVLSLDADEELSEELRRSIAAVKERLDHDAYEMSRRTNYCGTWVRHGGWYPDRKVRLFRRSKGRWTGGQVHEKFSLADSAAPVGRLTGDLLHYSFQSLNDHLERIERYANLGARELFELGVRPSPLKLVVSPAARFVRDYVLRAGFLDGRAGFQIARLSARAARLKYLRARALFDKGNAHG